MNVSVYFKKTSWILAFFSAGAMVLAGHVATVHAAVLVYEPFNYIAGQNLNGRSGGSGFAAGSSWSAGSSSPTSDFLVESGSSGTAWNGTVSSVRQTGNIVGSPVTGNTPDHLWASRSLDPSVTSTFTSGSTTWMSYIEAENFYTNGNGTGGMFAIGQGLFDGTGDGSDPSLGRGWEVHGGAAIGIGITSAGVANQANPKYFTAATWATNSSGTYYKMDQLTSPTPTGMATSHTTSGPAYIGIAKIVWGDATHSTTIQEASFVDGTSLSETAFNSSANLVTSTATVDPTTFNKISLGGARFNVDELSIGTTFNDAIGVTAVVPEPGTFPLSLLAAGLISGVVIKWRKREVLGR